MSKNKTILIIGAKSDIALAVAHKFASEGYSLQLAARNSSELYEIVSDLKIRYEIKVTVYELDILKNEIFADWVNSLDSLPDIAFCAVGILGNQEDDEKNVFNSALVMRTNYEGPALLLSEIANLFEKRGSGSIIGISSVAGDRGRASNYIYGSSKSAFTAFLSGLRNRLHISNINVITILPGFVNTKMTSHLALPIGITSTSKKIASLVYKSKSKSKIIYVFPWRFIMMLILFIPESIFKKLKI
jgi:short-subunit dehydrogenase